jgi:hypothetical protein
MIVLVISFLHAYTLQRYLETWGASLRSRIKLLYYEDIFYRRSLPRGAYLFTDLERLTPAQLQQAETFARYIAIQGLPVLNQPGKVLRRYDLLHLLYKQGINSFRVFRLEEQDDSIRFPVFLRQENEHNGPISPLLENASQLQSALNVEKERDSTLIVEYCDVADAVGIHRKYSAFLIGDRFIPRHLLFSKEWVTKYPELVDEALVEEERHYLFDVPHPHEPQIRTVFKKAGIDYGRIDYAYIDGRIQIWEINTNPTIATPLSRTHPLRVDAFKEIASRLRAAFEEVAEKPSAAPGVPLIVPSELRAKLGIQERETWELPFRQSARPIRLWLHHKKAYLLRKVSKAKRNPQKTED